MKRIGLILSVLAISVGILSGCGGIGIGGGKDSFVEKLFKMPYEDLKGMEIEDVEKMADEDDVLYGTKYGFYTTLPCDFFGSDCLMARGSYYSDALIYYVAFEDADELKTFKSNIEKYLNNTQLKGMNTLKLGDMSNAYVVEKTDEMDDELSGDLEYYLSFWKEGSHQAGSKMDTTRYKIVSVEYFDCDDDYSFYMGLCAFPKEKTYTNMVAEIVVSYVSLPYYVTDYADPNNEWQKINDILSGDTVYISDYVEELEEMYPQINTTPSNHKDDNANARIGSYFIEKHNDLFGFTDEEKRYWYLDRFGYDIERKKTVDLSYYDSIDEYMSVNFKAEDEASAAYSTYLTSQIDDESYREGRNAKEVADEFLKYMQFGLFYLNNDDYPELLVWSYDELEILSYVDGEVVVHELNEDDFINLSVGMDFYYKERSGECYFDSYTTTGGAANYYEIIERTELSDNGEFKSERSEYDIDSADNGYDAFFDSMKDFREDAKEIQIGTVNTMKSFSYTYQ